MQPSSSTSRSIAFPLPRRWVRAGASTLVEVYAQDLYTRFKREGALNPGTGRAYREAILAPGATEEPDTLLRKFLGRPLSYDAFFAEMGIGTTGTTKPTP